MIRQLTHEDIPEAFELSYAAGWNQTAEDWHRLIRLSPDGCFCCTCDGKLVATASLLCHGKDLAWLGMILTHRDYQRRGYAKKLMDRILEFADFRHIPTVKLDATEQGRPVYTKFGFVDEQPIERWQRQPGPILASSAILSMGPPNIRNDREAFGADRGALLGTLGNAWRLGDTYVMERKGARAHYLGPCVAKDPAEAEAAIQAVVAMHAHQLCFWDLFPQQESAAQIANDLGFSPVRHLMRMRRGSPLPAKDRLVFATGGFEAG